EIDRVRRAVDRPLEQLDRRQVDLEPQVLRQHDRGRRERRQAALLEQLRLVRQPAYGLLQHLPRARQVGMPPRQPAQRFGREDVVVERLADLAVPSLSLVEDLDRRLQRVLELAAVLVVEPVRAAHLERLERERRHARGRQREVALLERRELLDVARQPAERLQQRGVGRRRIEVDQLRDQRRQAELAVALLLLLPLLGRREERLARRDRAVEAELAVHLVRLEDEERRVGRHDAVLARERGDRAADRIGLARQERLVEQRADLAARPDVRRGSPAVMLLGE